MARCSACDTYIFFGGVPDGDDRYCNQDCHRHGVALKAASTVPRETLLAEAKETRDGPCPVCSSKRGGVDVRTSYRALSFIVLTHWTSRARVSCRVCHYKAVVGNSLLTFLFGWWGFPWGILATPVQLVRNLIALIPRGATAEPSERLLAATRLRLGAEMLEEGGEGEAQQLAGE